MNTLCLLQHESQFKGQLLTTEVESTLGIHFQQRLWKTCLRKVFFFSENELQVELSQELNLIEGAEAKRVLLEILCGLRSPIVGETEVLGQFKAFWVELQSKEPLFAKRISRDIEEVMTAVKKIRSESLINLGCQSYGSLVRRMVKDSGKISLLGGGQLAQEIYPWIDHHEVQVIVRDPSKLPTSWKSVEQVSALSSAIEGEVLIVAAPISNKNLHEVLNKGQVQRIIDLRGEERLFAQDDDGYLSLNGFFKVLDGEKSSVKMHFVKAMNQVKEIYVDWSNSVSNRPMGWDDLCM